MNLVRAQLVFNRDMFLDIPLIADIQFNLHDKVYVHNAHTASDKLKPVWSGPFTIRQVHTNNTVTLQPPHGVIERITIRRLKLAKHPLNALVRESGTCAPQLYILIPNLQGI